MPSAESYDHPASYLPLLCAELLDEADRLAAAITAELRTARPDYAVLPPELQYQRIVRAIRTALRGLAGRRLPTAAELEEQRATARHFAEHGVSLSAMVHAYQYCATRVSGRLQQLAGERGEQARHELLTVINLTWAWLQATGAAAISAYTAATSSRERVETGKATRLVDALFSADVAGEPIAALAESLGLDPARTFQVICCPAPEPVREPVEEMMTRLRRVAGRAVAAARTDLIVVVFQEVADEEVLSALGDPYIGGAGIGLPRVGLRGAATSLADAEGALLLARSLGRTVRYEDDWMLLTLMPELPHLRELIGSDDCGDQEHLRAAVAAYSENWMNLSTAAKRLHLHPNTLKYRLDRWQQLTGWDPRSFDGLHRSLLHNLMVAVRRSE